MTHYLPFFTLRLDDDPTRPDLTQGTKGTYYCTYHQLQSGMVGLWTFGLWIVGRGDPTPRLSGVTEAKRLGVISLE